MKTFEKIMHMSEKGQITLPVAWRSRIGTNVVRVIAGKGDRLEIAPVHAEEDDETGWVSIFDKDRDNGGKGVTVDDILRALGRPRHSEKKKKR